MFRIRPFAKGDEDAVIALWRECDLTRPWNDPRKDIQRKLAVQPELFLVGEQDGEIVATVMAGYEGHRGWINYFGGKAGLSKTRLRPAHDGRSGAIVARVRSTEDQSASARVKQGCDCVLRLHGVYR